MATGAEDYLNRAGAQQGNLVDRLRGGHGNAPQGAFEVFASERLQGMRPGSDGKFANPNPGSNGPVRLTREEMLERLRQEWSSYSPSQRQPYEARANQPDGQGGIRTEAERQGIPPEDRYSFSAQDAAGRIREAQQVLQGDTREERIADARRRGIYDQLTQDATQRGAMRGMSFDPATGFTGGSAPGSYGGVPSADVLRRGEQQANEMAASRATEYRAPITVADGSRGQLRPQVAGTTRQAVGIPGGDGMMVADTRNPRQQSQPGVATWQGADGRYAARTPDGQTRRFNTEAEAVRYNPQSPQSPEVQLTESSQRIADGVMPRNPAQAFDPSEFSMAGRGPLSVPGGPQPSEYRVPVESPEQPTQQVAQAPEQTPSSTSDAPLSEPWHRNQPYNRGPGPEDPDFVRHGPDASPIVHRTFFPSSDRVARGRPRSSVLGDVGRGIQSIFSEWSDNGERTRQAHQDYQRRMVEREAERRAGL